jgi:hypothetical protein
VIFKICGSDSTGAPACATSLSFKVANSPTADAPVCGDCKCDLWSGEAVTCPMDCDKNDFLYQTFCSHCGDLVCDPGEMAHCSDCNGVSLVYQDTPVGTQSGSEVPLGYTLYAAPGQPTNYSIKVEYSVNGAAGWYTALRGTTGEPTTNLLASPLGTHHNFAWNSLGNNVGMQAPQQVVTAITISTGSWISGRAVSKPFIVNNCPGGCTCTPTCPSGLCGWQDDGCSGQIFCTGPTCTSGSGAGSCNPCAQFNCGWHENPCNSHRPHLRDGAGDDPRQVYCGHCASSGPCNNNTICEPGNGENCANCSVDCGQCPTTAPPGTPTCGAMGGDSVNGCRPSGVCDTGYGYIGISSDCTACCKRGPTCGAMGGATCSQTSSCPNGATSLGASSDPCVTCCSASTLNSCGGMGGNYCSATTSCPAGATNLGQSSDCMTCCNQPPLPTCSVLGGNYCPGPPGSGVGCPAGSASLGPSSDCSACCWTRPPPPTCGGLGGDTCLGTPCSPSSYTCVCPGCPAGYTDMGRSSDCCSCCQKGPSCGSLAGLPPVAYCSGSGSCPASNPVNKGVTWDCNPCCSQ